MTALKKKKEKKKTNHTAPAHSSQVIAIWITTTILPKPFFQLSFFLIMAIFSFLKFSLVMH